MKLSDGVSIDTWIRIELIFAHILPSEYVAMIQVRDADTQEILYDGQIWRLYKDHRDDILKLTIMSANSIGYPVPGAYFIEV